MKKLVASAICCSALWATGASAAECDLEYVVRDGDTLTGIAKFAYGRADYQLIYSRNAGVLSSISDLPVGVALTIPCQPGEDGLSPNLDTLPDGVSATEAALKAEAEAAEIAAAEAAKAAEAEAARKAEEEAAAQAAADAAAEAAAKAEEAEEAAEAERIAEEAKRVAEKLVAERLATSGDTATGPVRILTANGQPPYADEALRGGGMATELSRRAFAEAGVAEDGMKIVFIDDRESHLEDLLPYGSFAVGYPWLKPECDDLDLLEEIAPKDAWMCETFAFSEPFYEYVYGFFVQAGEYSSTRTDFETFAESKVCRPAGGSTTDLAVRGLTEESATLVRPETAADCVRMLVNGEVDAISAEVFAVETAMAELDAADAIEELPDLSILSTIHAIAPKDKPQGAEAMAKLNKGLIDMKISGEWFRVVSRYLGPS